MQQTLAEMWKPESAGRLQMRLTMSPKDSLEARACTVVPSQQDRRGTLLGHAAWACCSSKKAGWAGKHAALAWCVAA